MPELPDVLLYIEVSFSLNHSTAGQVDVTNPMLYDRITSLQCCSQLERDLVLTRSLR